MGPTALEGHTPRNKLLASAQPTSGAQTTRGFTTVPAPLAG